MSIFKIQGEVYHKFCPLLLQLNKESHFIQNYFLDGQETKVKRHLKVILGTNKNCHRFLA
uniref:Uncharacterized protein n=1 Tax=Arion vulgaris TaxID=1028688 RepID=A0A0B6XYW4_9EUPU